MRFSYILKRLFRMNYGQMLRKINSIHKKDDDINKVNKDIFNQLTKREYEVALLVGEGKSNKEISRELFITEGTVKNHITKILDKENYNDF